MERLSGMDATFLYVETPDSHMHVAMVGIYDVSTMVGGYSFEAFRRHIASRLSLVPPFRRRLVEVPFQFHHPVWIEDPDFDLDYHVRRVTAPEPGGRRELARVASEIASVPLDRSRPLWEAWVVEGLKQNRIGFICKVHHAAIDGASGAEIMTALYDLTPSPEPTPVLEIEPERVPNGAELLGHAAVSKLKRATNSVPLATRTIKSASTLIGSILDSSKSHGAVPLSAPHTPFNRAIGPRRTTSFERVELEEMKAVKDALGVKVNDVVLALCAGTLRRYLELHDALPPEPLIAVCPVSVRIESERGTQGNKVSAMFASLATNVDDIGERLEVISRSTAGAKEDQKALGARTLTDWAEWAAPKTFGLAARTYSSMNLADRHRPIHNLVISNVPGPPFPLYLAGAELVAAYPMGPIMDGAGLNITVLSYRSHVDIGFLADADLVPDIWDLADQVRPAFDEIKAYAGITDPTIVKSAAPVTATSSPALTARRKSRPSTSASTSSKAPAKTTKKKAAAKKPAGGKAPSATKAAATTKSVTKKSGSTKATSAKKTTARKKPAAKRSAAKAKPAAKKPTEAQGAAVKSQASSDETKSPNGSTASASIPT